MVKNTRLILVIMCALLAMPQNSAWTKTTDDLRQNFRIGVSQYPSTLHPLFDPMVAKTLILGTAQRPITAHDADWLAACMLCEKLPSFENGLAKHITFADGSRGIAATYVLNKDLFWGDGTPVTTKDILFTWQVGKNPLTGVDNHSFFANDIKNIIALDDHTFTIQFAKNKCEFASIDTFHPLPAHLEKDIFEKDPGLYKNNTLYNTQPETAGLYFGPYIIDHVMVGNRITLKPNPYWKGMPVDFNTLTFKTIENSASLSAHLLSGDIDYIAGELGLSLDQGLSFEKRLMASKPHQFKTVFQPGLTYEHIDLKWDQPPFNNIDMRQALMYGLQRHAINDSLYKGQQPVADTNIHPLDTVHDPDVPKYTYDPARADMLLTQSGWIKKEDGFRYNQNGEPLRLTLSTTAGNKTRELILQAIQSDWQKLGIQVHIKNEPPRVLFGSTLSKRDFDGGIMYAWMSTPRNIPKTTLYSDMIPSDQNAWSGQNYTGYKNKRMDKIIDDLETVCDTNENQRLWAELQTLYATELPALPLYYRSNSFFIPTAIKGIIPTGHMHPSTLWIENRKIK